MKKILTFKAGLLALLALFLLPAGRVVAQNIRVVGKVVTKDTARVPIPNVMLVDMRTQTYLTETDAEGVFRLDCDPDAKIRFQSIDVEPEVVRIKGRTNLVVELKSRENILREAVVVAKGDLKDTIRIEPGDVLQTGNRFRIRAQIKMGEDKFAGNCRLVAQPVLYNYTKKEAYLMPPMVVDGRNYGRTQRRMYDVLSDDGSLVDRDPLGKYVTYLEKDSIGGKGRQRFYSIVYRDSVDAVLGKRDFIRCDITYTVEDYSRVLYCATENYAEGVVNPLRFLQYPNKGSIVTDSAYYPRPELQLRDSRGQVNLLFNIGKTTLDMNNPQNRAELDKMEKQLKLIASMEGSSIKSFKVKGTASPDGGYDLNWRLAQGRTATARDMVLSRLDEETRMSMFSAAEAQVAPWDSVVAMLRADGRTKEAEEMADIIAKHPTHNAQSAAMRRLPYYRSLLEKSYLPRLRRVEYEIKYDIRRVLTVEEIDAYYRKDPNSLSKYEFFRLIRAEKDADRRETICRDALRVHPDFWMAANDLQALLIDQNRSDDRLLERFVKPKSHVSMLTNHIMALLDANRYAAADTIATYVKKTPETELLLAVVGVNNDRIQANYKVIEKSSPLNRVIICLYMNRNQEAFEACRLLPEEDAFTHYLLATCYKRLSDEEQATAELKKALQMNPELEKDAMVDGDLRKLYKKIKNID